MSRKKICARQREIALQERLVLKHMTDADVITSLLNVVFDTPDFSGSDDTAIEAIGAHFASWFAHIGFDHRAVTRGQDAMPALRAHYQLRRGQYDVKRLERDLVTWPPIAAAILESSQAITENLPDDL